MCVCIAITSLYISLVEKRTNWIVCDGCVIFKGESEDDDGATDDEKTDGGQTEAESGAGDLTDGTDASAAQSDSELIEPEPVVEPEPEPQPPSPAPEGSVTAVPYDSNNNKT